LRIVESRVYRGGNVWSYDPAIHLVLDLGVLEGYPTDALPGLTERLLEALPGLHEHSCSRGHRGGFVERLEEGTWLGHVAEHVALQLQQEAGHDQRRGKTRAVTGSTGVYNVVYGYTNEEVGLAAGRLAVRLLNHLVATEDGFDFADELERFLTRAERTAFGPSTTAILEEAVSRDIPFIRLNTGSLVQLGQGVHQQRIRATMTSRTSALAVDIASDKDLTTRLLGSAGLPVPRQESVRSADGAVAAARRIGYPVVVKPLDGNHGRGVCLDLTTEDDVRLAFAVAEEQSRRGWVIVESFVTGRDYRCLIVGGRMQAIAERVPAHVVGDGTHTVRELVDATNADPRRGVGHEKVLTRIRVDAAAEELLRQQGISLDDVPEADRMVKLALTGNMSTGGISIDRTFDAHPDNVEVAEEAARLIGLDVAGIDFICPDIAAPVRETGGAICEVNAAPGFRMHTHPTVGEPQFIAAPVVDLLFPPGAPSRVPIVAVTGTNGKTTTSRMIAHIMKGVGRRVGM
ncbi:MAG: cyanophycin synthetase family protein, partial [Phycicoccus sp.]